MKSNKSICCVLVTYNPESSRLFRAIEAVAPQVNSIVVIDNGSDNPDSFFKQLIATNKVKLLKFSDNKGLPFAQNEGIKYAKNIGAKYILFLDQDSIAYKDMVKNLSKALFNSSNKVVATGPCFFLDEKEKNKSLFSSEFFGIPFKIHLTKNQFVHSLISSGSLVKIEAFDSIGYFKSQYFIDLTDSDWCFRARNINYLFIGVHNAFMQHSIGYDFKRIWFVRWRTISLHIPLRNYYSIRNTILMIRENEISMLWIIFYIAKVVLLSIFFIVFYPDRKIRFKLISLGFYHGLINVAGRLNLKTFKCDTNFF
jgi:rhamnosyltransferase